MSAPHQIQRIQSMHENNDFFSSIENEIVQNFRIVSQKKNRKQLENQPTKKKLLKNAL